VSGVRRLDLADVPAGRRAVALGTFDGVHLGHRAVIAAARAAADREGVPVLAATFDPRPAAVLRPGTPVAALATLEHRIELLGEAGADEVVVLAFTAELAALEPAVFATEILLGRLGAVAVAVGADFRFGRDRAGDVATLSATCAQAGVAVEGVRIVDELGGRISSSRIRGLLAEGEVAEAAALLGRPPCLDGVVVPGDRRGRTLGFPTANLQVGEAQLVPADGVYAGWALDLDGGRRDPAAVSIGRNPHFGDVEEIRVEAHLIDYRGDDLYGRRLRLELGSRLRGQERYEDVDALIAQIGRDVDEARRRADAG
jgi:riboflavin kinase/FMN adenylyltransferase